MHSSPAAFLPHTPPKIIQEQQIAKSNHTSHRLAITSSPNSNHGSYWWTTTCEKLSFWYLKSVVCKTLSVSAGGIRVTGEETTEITGPEMDPTSQNVYFSTTFQHYLSMLQTVQLIYLPDTVFQWITFALRTWKLYFFLATSSYQILGTKIFNLALGSKSWKQSCLRPLVWKKRLF